MKITLIICLILFCASLVLNIVLLKKIFQQDPYVPSNVYGNLNEDIVVGHWNNDEAKPLLSLPKGLTVKRESAPLGGAWEQERFSFVVTSDRQLVDYNSDLNNHNKDHYTADGWENN